ncbi:LOW QUALITY PROTEIN: protein O-mannosyl-transferase TMTC2-like [Homalodisca vitripennis]|uniref:LOW QUALITY PROTEIN: protein O-mannosyl-transferase TMTC2-like n=1 Tax=Homalodisca vitripennis TaxID=197043 RepID=UPI001EECD838|nr:LOW QUALITY PROTEIN: protein O-mannosyl-transferase TMTC2-like [Homalodisca vitripennis]
MGLLSLDWDGFAVCLLAVGVYVNTLGHGFVYDDNRAILTNPDVQASSHLTDVFHNDFWGTPLSSSNSHGSYRPLCTLSYRVNHWISGFQPFGFHLVNIFLHGLATLLVLVTGRGLLPGRASSLAAALFAVHPVHVEAVAGLAGRADVLSSVFYLISFLCYQKHVKVRDYVLSTKLPVTKEVFVRSTVTQKRSAYHKRTEETNFTNEKYVFNFKTVYSIPLFPKGESVYFSLFLVFSVCALLSKEPGITVIPLAICYDIILHLRSKRLPTRGLGAFCSASASLIYFSLILLCRLYVMGLHTPSFSKADNPTAKEASILTRTLTFLYLPVFNFLLLVCPRQLSFDWSMDAIPRITSPFDSRLLPTALFYYILYYTVHSCVRHYRSKHHKSVMKRQCCKVCKQNPEEDHHTICKIVNNNNLPASCHCKNSSNQTLSKNSIVTMCLAFIILPFTPATNLFFYVGFVVAERVLYLPSVGFCMLVALGAHALWNHYRNFVLGGILLLLAVLSARTFQRNRDWASEESLYRSAVHINPSKAYGNLGSILSTAGRLEEAETALRRALEHRPNMADVHYNLGNLLNRQQKFNEALINYQYAIQYRPSLAVAHLNLGQVMETLDRWEEAEEVYRKCSQLDVTGLKDPRSHEEARAACLRQLSRLCDERTCQPEVVHFLKQQIKSQNSLLNTRGHSSSSRLSFNSITSEDNRRSEGYTKLAALNKTKASESEELFLRAIQNSPDDPAAYVNYGQLLVQLGKVVEAAGVYLKAAELAPRQHALVTSAAIALRQAGRLAEAEVLYRQARDLKPNDATSHSNLGAIFHLQGKYRQAASCYREALRLAPGDHITVTNLHKLRNLLARNKR